MVKYVFMTGGVFSSLGKGLTTAAMAMLMERCGYKVGMLKLDPYLNVDPGTMNPFQHGEVYVTDDGAETDLDLGHYYRFTSGILTKYSSTTTGQIYDTVIKKERHGDYLGQTVQVIPHITDEIKRRILLATKGQEDVELIFVEIGGTVGDIESLPFLEAIRQFRLERPKDCFNIHLTYVPYLPVAGELKTKPTQHSVQTLRSIGLIPDLIICRCENPLPTDLKQKIALFCSVPKQAVIEAPDVKNSIYEIPLFLKDSQIENMICEGLHLPLKTSDTSVWELLLQKSSNREHQVKIAIVGKYVQHKDAYKSIFEALDHAGISESVDVKIQSFDPEEFLEDRLPEAFLECSGVLIPGGFGQRGWENMIRVTQYCREQKIPFFGICLGMQALVIEFARHVAHISSANSTEMQPETPNPVISLLSQLRGITAMGGTMRLGSYPCHLQPHTKAFDSYQEHLIHERHRHRYELNNDYIGVLQQNGLVISGEHRELRLCEIVEVKNHPWMVGVQFHPEFKSKFLYPHPLFKGFVRAVIHSQAAVR